MPKRKLPHHWSEAKNEAEEAAWWDANSERLMFEAAKRGTLKRGTLEQVLAEMKTAANREETRLLSLRIPVSDIERAKAQAEKKGMGYQTYLKSLLHQALTPPAPLRYGYAMKRKRTSSAASFPHKRKP